MREKLRTKTYWVEFKGKISVEAKSWDDANEQADELIGSIPDIFEWTDRNIYEVE